MLSLMFNLKKYLRYTRIIITTILTYIQLFLMKIKFGKKVIFDGAPYIVCHPKTRKFTIGNNCKFNSSKYSNFIGINHHCILTTMNDDAEIVIGNNSGFSGTTIASFKSITIGNNVKCGANTLITDSDWHPEDKRAGEPKPVVIHDNVWLGYGAVVLKGVTIGENSLIGAGSVVVRDIPPNVIAGGNPCKIIREIDI